MGAERTHVRTANGRKAKYVIDKTVTTVAEAVAGIRDGATIMIGGFGRAGQPVELIDALIEQGASDLTIINNNAGNGEVGLAALLAKKRVRRILCSFPRQHDSWVFDGLYRAGEIELELVPQGNLAERIRAAGAGIGAFFSPTGVGTQLAEGKELREIDGRVYALEYPIRADVALVSAYRGDRWGNLVYRETARNFGPIMAAAATTTIVQVDELVPLGALDPEHVVTPGIFVDRVVAVGERGWLDQGEFVGGVDIEGRPLEGASTRSATGVEGDQ
jgi:3-oxoadipate CoA-transferase alpha subunit